MQANAISNATEEYRIRDNTVEIADTSVASIADTAEVDFVSDEVPDFDLF